MKATSINKVIDDFNALILEEKEFALEIIHKMFIEAQRKSLLKRVHAAASNYNKGKVKSGSLKDLHNDLEND